MLASEMPQGDVWTYCRWKKNNWCEWNIDGYDNMDWIPIAFPIVTHWMPIPTPPQERNNNSLTQIRADSRNKEG